MIILYYLPTRQTRNKTAGRICICERITQYIKHKKFLLTIWWIIKISTK